jgi:glutamyl-tRNA reductase
VLLNRSGARAERLARRIGAEAADFDSRHAVVSGVDGVILATSAGTPVITAESLAPERLRKRREGCWLTMFDLSVPLNTDPAVRHLPNVELLTLDDLPGTAAGSRSPSAEAIIADEARYFRNWLSSRRLNRASVA